MLLQLDPQDPSGWGEIFATYGPFAPFAVFCLTVIGVLWKFALAKDAEVKRLTEAAMDRMLPLVLKATDVLAEAATAMKEGRMVSTDAQALAAEMQRLREDIHGVRTSLDRKR